MIDEFLKAVILVNILSATIRIATPLLMAALGELVAEHSGVMNLGLEGTMLTAAFVAFLVAERTDSVLVAILAAGVAGGLMTLILAFVTVSLKVDQIIAGLAINLLASGVTLFWFRSAYTAASREVTPLVEVLRPFAIPGLSALPFVGSVLFSQSPLTYLAFLAVPALWYLLYRTKHGLWLRSLGENPRAADMAGISVLRWRYGAVVFGGIMAGIGGAFVSIGSVERFVPEITAGRGWLAIVIVIAGNWKPGRILLATLLFAFLDAFQLQVQGVGVQMPYQILLALPYVLAIVVMIAGRARSVAPEALGVPYSRE